MWEGLCRQNYAPVCLHRTSLHDGDHDTVKMKSLVRSYVWLLGMDGRTEDVGISYACCQQTQQQTQLAPVHVLEWPSNPVPTHTCCILRLLVLLLRLMSMQSGLKSLWSEKELPPRQQTSWESSLQTPLLLVSHNDSRFIGEEIQVSQGIWHTAHHRAHQHTPNGPEECFLQMFKQSMKAGRMEKVPLPTKLANILLAYRNTINASTGQTPAVLFWGRSLRSQLERSY